MRPVAGASHVSRKPVRETASAATFRGGEKGRTRTGISWVRSAPALSSTSSVTVKSPSWAGAWKVTGAKRSPSAASSVCVTPWKRHVTRAYAPEPPVMALTEQRKSAPASTSPGTVHVAASPGDAPAHATRATSKITPHSGPLLSAR